MPLYHRTHSWPYWTGNTADLADAIRRRVVELDEFLSVNGSEVSSSLEVEIYFLGALLGPALTKELAPTLPRLELVPVGGATLYDSYKGKLSFTITALGLVWAIGASAFSFMPTVRALFRF